MASIESVIYTVLAAATSITSYVDSRIYPQHRPQAAGKPSIVYFRVGGHREITIDGGYVNLENPRISIEIYSSSIDARREIGEAVLTTMENSSSINAIAAMSPLDFYDPYTTEYKRIIDFSIWKHE